MVLNSLAAGKDVYIEKPMTHRVEDGPKMIEAVRRNNRILQAGSQGRSSFLQKKAREIIASGQLGKVTKVIASYNRNSSTGAWNYPIPPDLKEGVNFNWKEWLGNAPSREYDPERVFRYRKYWDYSGGISTDLFVHLITSIHFILDAKVPTSVTAAGGILVRKDGREVPDTLDALFVYPEGFNVNMGSTLNNASTPEQGMVFLGTKGSLSLLGSSFTVAAENPKEGYAYSIDSWPKDLQEEFMNLGVPSRGGEPADCRRRDDDVQGSRHRLRGASSSGVLRLCSLPQRMQRKCGGRPPCRGRRTYDQPFIPFREKDGLGRGERYRKGSVKNQKAEGSRQKALDKSFR